MRVAPLQGGHPHQLLGCQRRAVAEHDVEEFEPLDMASHNDQANCQKRCHHQSDRTPEQEKDADRIIATGDKPELWPKTRFENLRGEQFQTTNNKTPKLCVEYAKNA